MKFIDLIRYPTMENTIKFKEQMVKILEDDIAINGDNGFGYKKIKIENINEDLEILKNENKRVIRE